MEKASSKETFAEVERLIVRGQIKAAAQLLDKNNPVPGTRLETLELARLYRRMGNPENTLRLLTPVVRPKAALLKAASNEEKLEYAIALQRLGSLVEATELLGTLNPAELPDVLLVQAVFLFSNWDYASAIGIIEKYLAMIPQDSYSARLGRVNLCAALVHEGRAEADNLLEGLIRDTQVNEEYLLMVNAFEISAQNEVRKGDYDKAELLLKKAEEVLSGVKVLDFLWVVKWKNIVQAFRQNSVAPLDVVRDEAQRKKHWETLREVDFYRLQIEYSEAVFLKLYYGTKSPFYRARIRKLFPQGPQVEEIVRAAGGNMELAGTGESGLDIFALTGELAPGTGAHALLVHFLSDSYRGFRTGELHSILFPGDYYNPDTSLNRVHQTVSRFRKTLSETIADVEVDIDDYVYRLQINKDARIRLPAHLPEPNPLAIRLFMFDQRYRDQVFSSEDVQDHLGISKASANKLLSQWVDASLIEIHLNQRPRLYKKR